MAAKDSVANIFGGITVFTDKPFRTGDRIRIEDISFTLNGSLFRFSEMLSQKLVSRAVYVFDDGVYAPATRVKPFQSLLIKYYGGTEANPQIRFCPYYSAPDITPQAPLWSLKTTISETDGAVTLLLRASSMATDDLDFKLDLPAGPQPPFGLARVYFPISHPSDLETSLQSDFRTGLFDFGLLGNI